VLGRRTPLDDTLDELAATAGLSGRDEALARAIATASLRRLGTLRQALETRLAKGLPKNERLRSLLITGAAQILFLDVPDHATVDIAVRLAQAEPKLKPFAGLTNAVLRRISRERDTILAEAGPWADTPEWLAARWVAQYGESQAQAIAASHRRVASIDVTAKADPQLWTDRLGGVLLPTGSIRLRDRSSVRDLPGYEEGAWWVQDAAAALPARLLQPRPGERIADLCAAPGGKTAQLASAGAQVLAVDRSPNRLRRLAENMARLKLSVETLAADALQISAEPFDAVLLDAPCSATGTLRRHPDVAWAKNEDDIRKLADLQRRLLDKAAELVRIGGRLVFCTCSLEPEEGERQAEEFLARHPNFARQPVRPEEVGLPDAVTATGDVRTLPCHLPSSDETGAGLDGFFVARFMRLG